MPRRAPRCSRTGRRGRGWRATACSWPSARTTRPSNSCARASESPTRSMRNGRSSMSRRRELLRLSAAERNRRIDLLRLAESLGAETVTLDGPIRRAGAARVRPHAQCDAARHRCAEAPGLRAWLRPSTTTEIVRRARGFDVITIGVADGRAGGARVTGELPARRRQCRFIGSDTRGRSARR